MNLSEDTWLVAPGRHDIASSPLLARLRTGVLRIGANWRARRQRAQDVGVLYNFSDRELWDLGLSRSDITGIENGTFRRD